MQNLQLLHFFKGKSGGEVVLYFLIGSLEVELYKARLVFPSFPFVSLDKKLYTLHRLPLPQVYTWV